MTNYTQEQREIITKFIETEILPMRSMVNQSLAFSVDAVSDDTLVEVINE